MVHENTEKEETITNTRINFFFLPVNSTELKISIYVRDETTHRGTYLYKYGPLIFLIRSLRIS